MVGSALGGVGWPVVQGSVSTLLAVLIMLIVPAYVVRMFARTTILVVVLGLIHGMWFLPCILAAVIPDPNRPINDVVPYYEMK
jgi:uncharacterized membrane protein YqjE